MNSEAVTNEKLVSELIRIGSVPKLKGGLGSEPFFWRPEVEGVGPIEEWDPRTREIGEELYRKGDGSIGLMRQAHERVVAALGAMAGHALSAHWDNIGLENYMEAGKECWLH